MLHFVMEDQSLLSGAMLIQILRETLIKKKIHYWLCVYTYRMSCKLGFKLQIVVPISTTEVEYMAATLACNEAIWIQRLLEEFGHKQQKIPMFCDSKSALHIARNPTFYSRTKHIRVQYHFVQEVVEDVSVNLQKIHTKENLADVLTKPINADKFVCSRSSCGLVET